MSAADELLDGRCLACGAIKIDRVCADPDCPAKLNQRIAALEAERDALNDRLELADAHGMRMVLERDALEKRLDWTVLDNAKQRMAVDDLKAEVERLRGLVADIGVVCPDEDMTQAEIDAQIMDYVKEALAAAAGEGEQDECS